MRLTLQSDTTETTIKIFPRIVFSQCDEEYVRDERDAARPSEVVQSKLLNVMPKGMAIPVSSSHFHRHVGR